MILGKLQTSTFFETSLAPTSWSPCSTDGIGDLEDAESLEQSILAALSLICADEDDAENSDGDDDEYDNEEMKKMRVLPITKKPPGRFNDVNARLEPRFNTLPGTFLPKSKKRQHLALIFLASVYNGPGVPPTPCRPIVPRQIPVAADRVARDRGPESGERIDPSF
jgi:hypothetical protein